MTTRQLYMTFKLLKRRYFSPDDDEDLRRLTYFNHPYEIGNDIRLIDDINLDKPVSLALLGTDLVGAEQNKRGQKNAVKRESSESVMEEDALEFEPFDSEKTVYF